MNAGNKIPNHFCTMTTTQKIKIPLKDTTADAYLITPKNKTKSGILLIHDVFGIEHEKNKQISIKIAEASGCIVLAPDFYRGKPYVPPTTGWDSNHFSEWLKMFPLNDAGYVFDDISIAYRYMTETLKLEKIGISGLE